MVDTTNINTDVISAQVVEGGTLNEQGVLNVALSFFGLAMSITDDATEKEVMLFNQVYPIAQSYCASMSEWTFLTKTAEYEEDDVYNDEPVLASNYNNARGTVKGDSYTGSDGNTYCHVYTPYKNYKYAYSLPSDFLRVRYIDNDPRIGYAIKGKAIYCNSLGMSLDYLSSTMHNLPIEFGYLVAYKCAVDLSMYLDPEGTALSRASTLLQQTYSLLKQRDDLNSKLQNPPQNQYVDIDTIYWGYKK